MNPKIFSTTNSQNKENLPPKESLHGWTLCILHPYLKTYSSIFCSEAVGNLSILLDVMKGVNSSTFLLAGHIISKSCMMFMFSLLRAAASFVVFLSSSSFLSRLL
jgi:hypothetical protein